MTIKINNMTQKQQDAIDSIMDYFKFEQVQKVMPFNIYNIWLKNSKV